MLTTIIITSIVLSSAAVYIMFMRKSTHKFSCDQIIAHLDNKIFPGGKEQKREGALQVKKLLKNKINIQEAEELYVNKIALFYFEKFDSKNEQIIHYLTNYENSKINFFDKIELYDFFTHEHQKYNNQSWTDAYFLSEISLNGRGKPVDYRLLEVNHAFEELTGLERIELIGKTIKQVFPSIDDFWIQTYGEVATKGKLAKFNHFDNVLNKSLDVTSYSPRKNQFISFIQVKKDRTPNTITIRA